ncbi:cell division suppressor protein YneA [Listeria sp. ILCC797]|uniref:cell division suppressor protein YneA n=1 Tax=Listeria sp. ILCC797 TaxID=1918333 RepID=UPI000B58988C|nr:cell division suppressor protein YneA [Listeria sp. ILCC797]
MTLKLFWDKYYIAIIFVVASVLMGLTLLFYASATNENKYSTIDVASGDSLWVLANEHAEKANMDKMTFIKWVEKENHLNNSTLKAGDEIVIPIKKNEMNSDSTIQLANE